MEKNMGLMKKAWDKEQRQKKLPPLISWEEAGERGFTIYFDNISGMG